MCSFEDNNECPNTNRSAVDEEGRSCAVCRSSLDLSEGELRAALTQEQMKCVSLTHKYEELKRQSGEATVQAEVEEEFLTNRLLRQLTEKLKENELLSVRIEDDVANVESLKQKLNKVLREKVYLENKVEALQENFVNRSLRRATSEERSTQLKTGLSDSSWCGGAGNTSVSVCVHTDLTPAPRTGSGSACGRSRSRKTSRPFNADCQTEYLVNNMSAAADDLTKWLCSSELDGVNACIDEMNGLESYLMKLIQGSTPSSVDVHYPFLNSQRSGDFSNTFNRLMGLENRMKDAPMLAQYDASSFGASAKLWHSFKGVVSGDGLYGFASSSRKYADVSTAAESSGHRSGSCLDDVAQSESIICNTATDCSAVDSSRGRSDTSGTLPSRRIASAPHRWRWPSVNEGKTYSAGGYDASTDDRQAVLELEEDLCAASAVGVALQTPTAESGDPTTNDSNRSNNTTTAKTRGKGDYDNTGTSPNGQYLQPVAENIKDWYTNGCDDVDRDKNSVTAANIPVKFLIDNLLNYIEDRRRTLQRRKEKILLHASKSTTPVVGDGPAPHSCRLSASPPNLAVLHMHKQSPEQHAAPCSLDGTKDCFPLTSPSVDSAVSSTSSPAGPRPLMHSGSIADSKFPTIDELYCLPEMDDGSDNCDEE